MILSARHERAERVEVAHATVSGMHAWRVDNLVGESPVWDASTQTLLWIDVRAPSVLRLDPRAALLTRWELPEVVGALVLGAPGRVVLALTGSIAILELETARLQTFAQVAGEPPGNRLNDGKVSRSGRWFVFGSMDDRPLDKQMTGSLYRIDAGGELRLLHRGLTVCNGIEWSPDGTTLYFSDSHAGRVWSAPWNEAAGTMGAPQRFADAGERIGRPDGAAVDASGAYWSAGVSAGCLNRYSVDGHLQASVLLPCRAPTMPCFGGKGLATLYVTSLVRPGWSHHADTFDGCLLGWPAASPGLPSTRWRSP